MRSRQHHVQRNSQQMIRKHDAGLAPLPTLPMTGAVARVTVHRQFHPQIVFEIDNLIETDHLHSAMNWEEDPWLHECAKLGNDRTPTLGPKDSHVLDPYDHTFCARWWEVYLYHRYLLQSPHVDIVDDH